MKKQNRTSRVNVEARMEKQSALFAIIEDMVADIIRIPNSELKESLISKTGNLLNEIYDDRSVRAKYIEAFFKTLNHGYKQADSNWLIRPVSLDDRSLTIPLGDTQRKQYPRESYDPTTHKGLERRLCCMQHQLGGVVLALDEVIKQVGDGMPFRNTHLHTENE